MSGPPIRVLLVGPCGSGKSAFGNSLLDRDTFRSEKSLRKSSVTVQLEKQTLDHEGHLVEIVDSPALTEIIATNEFRNAFKIGFDVIALILPMDRVTESIIKTIKKIESKFKSEINNHLFVVFTHGDEPLQEFLDETNDPVLNRLRQKAQGFTHIDNKDPNSVRVQREIFLNMTLTLTKDNKSKRIYDNILRPYFKLFPCYQCCLRACQRENHAERSTSNVV